MKNKPQRERPRLRARSSYSRNNKREYDYPEWCRSKRINGVATGDFPPLPLSIRETLMTGDE